MAYFRKMLRVKLRRQANADATNAAVTIRVFMQVLLVIIFRVVERCGGFDFRRDWRSSPALRIAA